MKYILFQLILINTTCLGSPLYQGVLSINGGLGNTKLSINYSNGGN